jgi:hypothetical protein
MEQRFRYNIQMRGYGLNHFKCILCWVESMVSPSDSNLERLGTTQGLNDSRDRCSVVEIIFNVEPFFVGSRGGKGKVPMREESLRRPTPTFHNEVWNLP